MNYYIKFNYNTKYLFIDVNKLLDINDKTKIKDIHISYSDFLELPDLSEFINLESLIITNNKLKKLSDLSKCINLKYLYFTNNKLEELPDLSNLLNLCRLYCNDNKLSKLTNLPINLKILSCENNNITELNLSGLTQLEYLNISNNNIYLLPNLDIYNNLTEIYCNYNNLLSLPISILKCKKLYYYKNYKNYKNLNKLNYLLNKNIEKYYYRQILNYYFNNLIEI